jgi:hypothetical protein
MLMSDRKDEGADTLRLELEKLRDALRTVRAPASDEARLRAAFRARREAAESDPATSSAAARVLDLRGLGKLAAIGALAASVALAVLVGLDRAGERAVPVAGESAESMPAVARADNDSTTAGAFQPLLYAPSMSPSESYNVVRVRIPLTSLGYGFDAPPDGAVEADVLIGEDGLARGIRFDTADMLVVSTASH